MVNVPAVRYARLSTNAAIRAEFRRFAGAKQPRVSVTQGRLVRCGSLRQRTRDHEPPVVIPLIARPTMNSEIRL